MIEALDHLHIFSADVSAAAQYFADIFGARETSREHVRGLLVVRVSVQGVTLTLMEAAAGSDQMAAGRGNPGLDHFCFLVSDLEGTVASMQAKGATFGVEPRLMPNGAKIAFVNGPDGIIIELKEWTRAGVWPCGSQR
jgi:catechol 2,3-dioxygenase-like lactoylglutathione lyase family enzyme